MPRAMKHTWGGKRAGAGRPAEGAGGRRAVFRLDDVTDSLLDERAAAEGCSRGVALARCVREWAERRAAAAAIAREAAGG